MRREPRGTLNGMGYDPAGHSEQNPAAGDADVIVIRRSTVYAALLPMLFLAGLAAGYFLWGQGSNDPGITEISSSPQTRYTVSEDDDPALGPEDAPIVIIEFSDFNCPYCRKFHQETFPELMAAYPDQIRFVYRDYPILGQESAIAAQAAQCAGEQGEYWAFHDRLFSGGLALGRETYRIYAEALALDPEALAACLDSGQYAEEVQADARAAAELGVRGTPTLFINGIPVVGAQPLNVLAQLIDTELGR